MRLRQFRTEETSTPRVGVTTGDGETIVDLERAGEELGIEIEGSVRSLLATPCWRQLTETAVDYAVETGVATLDIGETETLTPITDPSKVVCVGLNYAEHAEEGDEEVPEEPLLFPKYPTAVVGPERDVVWDPSYTEQVDYEVELAAVLGKEVHGVDEAGAMDAIAGFTVANDISARDLQFDDDQWLRGKSLDTFCPLGPELVTTDEVGDPQDLTLWTEVNGKRVQESTTSNQIFEVSELVSFISRAFTLVPGDVILTGTPPGVGVFRDPPQLLDDGDVVKVGVESIGTLSNTCRHSTGP